MNAEYDNGATDLVAEVSNGHVNAKKYDGSTAVMVMVRNCYALM